MMRSLVFILLVMISCNDAERAKLFDVITAETCECSKQQNIAASAAIVRCLLQSAEKHDAELKEVGVDQNSEAGLKQLQYEISGRLESRCREVYMKALKERKVQ
jgi:hypothetical protein